MPARAARAEVARSYADNLRFNVESSPVYRGAHTSPFGWIVTSCDGPGRQRVFSSLLGPRAAEPLQALFKRTEEAKGAWRLDSDARSSRSRRTRTDAIAAPGRAGYAAGPDGPFRVRQAPGTFGGPVTMPDMTGWVRTA